MQVIISNHIEALAFKLKRALFASNGHPFEKRWVIVPSERVHEELAFRFANDPELQIATGFHFLTWREALFQLFPAIPSAFELSLLIESRLDKIEQLEAYLGQGGAARKGSLADKMAALFLKYMEAPEEKLLDWVEHGGWQQTLWLEIFGKDLPWKNQHPLQGKVFLFHPFRLTSYQVEIFRSMKAEVFLFSPCEMYWSDLKTAKEQQFLLKKNQELKEYFLQDHPLLANWGKVGRDLMRLLEEEDLIEAYQEPKSDSLLASIQKEILSLTTLDKKQDTSIQVHAATSQLHEVQLVWEILQTLPFEPHEVIVCAPNIQGYAPLIEMIFRERGGPYDFAIFCLEAFTKNPLMQGLQDLIDLAQYRFSKEAMQKLFSSPLFLSRFGFDREEAQRLENWISRVQIRYDLKGNHSCTWEAGLKRLVEAVVLPVQENRLSIEMSEADLLSRLIEVVQKLEKELIIDQELPLVDWIKKVKSWLEIFFDADPDNELIRQLNRFQPITDSFPFSTVERLIDHLFHQSTASLQSSHLQAVRFTSLQKGAFIPAKVIILMGMDEGSFPSKETPSSLQQLKGPPISEEDRYLFLEALCSAREQLIVTYSNIHPEDGKPQKASPLVEELCQYAKVEVTEHSCPQVSASQISDQTIPVLPSLPVLSWEISSLRRLARHPLQFFFEERLGIDFEWKETNHEFVLPPLELSRLRKQSLKQPLEKLVLDLQEEGRLPLGPFSKTALHRIEEEIKEYHALLEKLKVRPQEIFAIELSTACQNPALCDEDNRIHPALRITLSADQEVVIQGRIEDLSPQGFLFHGDDSCADLLKVWPIYLIVKILYPEMPLLMTKKGKISTLLPSDPLASLKKYLIYAEKALTTPSPLFPKWGRTILNEGKIPLTDEDDPVMAWMQTRDLIPPQEAWLQLWKSDFQKVFHEIV